MKTITGFIGTENYPDPHIRIRGGFFFVCVQGYSDLFWLNRCALFHGSCFQNSEDAAAAADNGGDGSSHSLS